MVWAELPGCPSRGRLGEWERLTPKDQANGNCLIFSGNGDCLNCLIRRMGTPDTKRHTARCVHPDSCLTPKDISFGIFVYSSRFLAQAAATPMYAPRCVGTSLIPFWCQAATKRCIFDILWCRVFTGMPGAKRCTRCTVWDGPDGGSFGVSHSQPPSRPASSGCRPARGGSQASACARNRDEHTKIPNARS